MASLSAGGRLHKAAGIAAGYTKLYPGMLYPGYTKLYPGRRKGLAAEQSGQIGEVDRSVGGQVSGWTGEWVDR